MKYINMIDGCQAHLPAQYASNIKFNSPEVTLVLWWKRTTPDSHVQKILVFDSLAVRVHTGCSTFSFYTPTKPLIQLHIKYKNPHLN